MEVAEEKKRDGRSQGCEVNELEEIDNEKNRSRDKTLRHLADK